MAFGTTPSILVADTDRDSRDQICSLVRSLGLSPETVETGADALAAVDRISPALVLLAADLADPSAYEVLRQLREQSRERLPIVVISALPDEPRDEIAALLLGADDYLAKPLKPDRFTARIRRLLRRAPAVHQANPRTGVALTKREREVLQLLVDGLRPSEIAESLCITKKTAATHIEHILAKLGAHSQAQAIAFAVRDDLLLSGARATEAEPRANLGAVDGRP